MGKTSIRYYGYLDDSRPLCVWNISEACIMTTRITREVIESYLNCRYKGHLKLVGEQGAKMDYQLLLEELNKGMRHKAVDKLLARHPRASIDRKVLVTADQLKNGGALILDATWEDDEFALAFDGLERVPDASRV